jgi:hypothetical protein
MSSLACPPPVFTLGEIRLLKSLYHELSQEELAIFFSKPLSVIQEICVELNLKRKEASHV